MEYAAEPNIALEALAYLGARANGHSVLQLEARLRAKGVSPTEGFLAQLAPLKALTARLDQALACEPVALRRLFGNIEGFPYNTIGSYSPAFLLFYPALQAYGGDAEGLFARMEGLSRGQVAGHILMTLGLQDKPGDESADHAGLLMDSVLALSIPSSSQVALLDLQRNYHSWLAELVAVLRPALRAMEAERDTLDQLAAAFGQAVARVGCAAYLRETSGLAAEEGLRYHLRPFFLGPDTNISMPSPNGDGGDIIYCGVLRGPLQRQLSAGADAACRVYEALRLLGDRTRFDILCDLRDRPAYGQELSDRFGLARNTIHHHMSKMLSASLVTCTVDGNKVYYDTDRERLDLLLRQLRRLLLGEDAQP